MKRVDALAERVLLLAPTGRDGAIAGALLAEFGMSSEICSDLGSFVAALVSGAACAVVAEEALQSADVTGLAGWLQDQPHWSDFPIILLSRHGGGPERNPAARRWAEILGNVTVIERPFHPTTLTAAVASAARARRRQYQARAYASALHESEERLQTAMRAADLGAWTLDLKVSRLETSAMSKTHYGRQEDELFDYEAFRASVVADDWPRLVAAVQHTVATGDDYCVVYRVIWPDGSEHWIDARGQPVRSGSGKIYALVGVTADISERRNAELERETLMRDLKAERSALAQLNQTLEARVAQRSDELVLEVAAREQAQEQLRQVQKMESIGQLTGGIAHDFNNLLMVVTSALTLLRRRMTPAPQEAQLIDGAIQAAERGAALTQRLLAFARQQDLKTDAVDLGRLLGGMRDLLERSLGPRFELHIDIGPSLPPAQIDTNQFELAVLNLVINARDAMSDGGAIDIRAYERHGDGRRDGMLAVSVADRGTGMDAETIKKAVEPFFSTKPVGKGTGLGLSMVHGLAVQLGGELVLESKPGEGTNATILVPRAANFISPTTAPATERTGGRAIHVVVVDDDRLVASLTTEMLRELGHDVQTVDSGPAALDLLNGDGIIDLLMTDHLMPGMTGLELIAEAREVRPGLPVLLATGFAEPSETHLKNVPRISKPYDLDALRDCLASFRFG